VPVSGRLRGEPATRREPDAVWWDGAIEARERMIFDAAELDAYVEDLVTEERARRGLPPARERPDGAIARVARRLRPA
jgi:hypothetical protein